ncbi:tripartite-type tricarboxylate transporter receptor subunit TctC [Bradyrhizobium algeriense]|uniref:Tripartite-type tricarboxylate transporter receptor subunit TctC n=1 Tax=Bradyrhizobium algeriense TaxID=634784 RepID=A0ABU8BJA2_9BRAD
MWIWERLFLIALVAVLPDLALSQPLQRWPERTVRLISPSSPGGSPDIVARLFAEKLSVRWKVGVIVENRPGADGMIAIQAVLGATDGHTLLATHSGAVTVTPAIRKLPYNEEDLRPLSTAAIDFLAVAVPATSSVRSLADLIAAAREKPGALNWYAAPGGPVMVFGEFVRNNRLDMVFVPYKAGSEAVRDLSESRIQVSLVPLATALPLAQAGRLRLIAITNPEAAPIAPDVPTALGAGHPELALQGFLGFFAPKSMPDFVRQQISGEIQAVANDPEIHSRLGKVGMIARGSTPGYYAQYLDEQRRHWDRIARSQKIVPAD